MLLPDLILLNGSSSSGKTSICKALQDQLPQGYLHFSVDDVFGWTPLRWNESGEAFRLETLPNGETPIVTGPEGVSIMRAWRHMVRAALDQGVRAVADDVFTDPATWDDWAAALAGKDVLLVGVRCELPELQRREQARGDRGIGQALWQHERVHAQGPYDVEVDTTATAPDACAAAIINAIQGRSRPGVLAQSPAR